MKILTAEVTTVKIGYKEFEGLLREDGVECISIQQAAIIFSVPQNNAQRDFKALLGAGFQFLKVKAQRSERQNRSENALKLIDFEKLIRKLDRKGNLPAQEISDELIGLSLKQLWSDAFNQKFEKQERQEFIKFRQKTKKSFWFIVDHISEYIVRNNKQDSANKRFYYTSCMDAINSGLFGKKSKQIKDELGIDKGELNRDHFGNEALDRIHIIQELAARYIDADIKPCEAVKKAIAEFKYTAIDYKS